MRRIPAFAHFLQVAAFSSGEVINFAKLSNDTGIAASTIREYYFLLEDTFLGFALPAWNKTRKRKALSTSKFYLFDVGIRNTLAKIRTLDTQTDQYGKALSILSLWNCVRISVTNDYTSN